MGDCWCVSDGEGENAIRPLALGWRNYLFCGNDASAYRTAIVYSLISTCKAADVNWVIEVAHKEMKCLLNLGECQSIDFAGQITGLSSCMIQFNILSYVKRSE